MDAYAGIDPSVPPGSNGCEACEADGGWWLHLRRCTTCGTIGCCDSSPAQHATAHFRETGHPIVRSFEPGETWFWNYESDEYTDGPELVAPEARPTGQGSPAPRDRVPADWRDLLH
ncbi:MULTISPECIES: UBP-type zinc finger domain-containing protein [unclassified Leifsonia]|uniref:UBP-type zinc finger domain-containing protein n=1 Tax=unclassified Leifsonia TaxID=2663824 RepID=UPI0006F61EC8|nr:MULTISPECIES: UBP-type zinc finger domain-containing protein [unclassified Leifsonia]KQX07062.1 hypothetical protein ASC59_04430 [Leifsonia sp. Root1293]KRA11345.1 hypothetical protein ASD61_04430 [Leifsonia sp. Root60]